jgi:hypothetical protein
MARGDTARPGRGRFNSGDCDGEWGGEDAPLPTCAPVANGTVGVGKTGRETGASALSNAS